MLVSTMSSTKQISTNLKDEWDVAPLMVYKEYSEDGKSVLVHGIEAAHSNSVGIAINAKSKVKDIAFVLAEYIASAEGQSIQAEEGFAIPIQVSVANSDTYINSTYNKGRNVQVFIDACSYESPGDWWLLRDKQWIDDWANLLNGDVRNGRLTLSGFYDSSEFKRTQSLLDDYTKR
jgi:ABC-type glycerol-3-phosphate transport system substrate-binding protein